MLTIGTIMNIVENKNTSIILLQVSCIVNQFEVIGTETSEQVTEGEDWWIKVIDKTCKFLQKAS